LKRDQAQNATNLSSLFRLANLQAIEIASSTWLIISALLFLSVSVRLYYLDKQSLECDEVYTISAANGQPYVYFSSSSGYRPENFPTTIGQFNHLLTPQMQAGLSEVTNVLKRNVQMPLFFYLMHYWLKLTGTGEWSLRLPSVVLGSLCVLMIFVLGKELFSGMVGLVAALFMALMPQQIYFSQQARPYPLLMLTVLIATYGLVLAQKHPDATQPRMLFMIASVLGFYTHYVFVFCAIAHTMYIWVISPLGKRNWRAWLVTFAGVGIALLPWVALVSLNQRKTSSEIVAWAQADATAGSVTRLALNNFLFLISVPEVPLGWLSVILAVALLFVGLITLRQRPSTLGLLGLLVAMPLMGIIAMDNILKTDAIRMIRYWMVITPALYLLMAVGMDWFTRFGNPFVLRIVAVTLVVTLTGWAGLKTARGELRHKPDEHRALAQYLGEQIKDPNHELIMTEGLDALPLAIAYYHSAPAMQSTTMLAFEWAVDPVNKPQLRAAMLPRADVWLVITGRSKGGSMLRNTGYQLMGTPKPFAHVSVYHYRRILPASSSTN
jgi:uncharacterized membrane protein